MQEQQASVCISKFPTECIEISIVSLSGQQCLP